MKVIKTASGNKKIKMSKNEWQTIGKKAGWMKTISANSEPYPRSRDRRAEGSPSLWTEVNRWCKDNNVVVESPEFMEEIRELAVRKPSMAVEKLYDLCVKNNIVLVNPEIMEEMKSVSDLEKWHRKPQKPRDTAGGFDLDRGMGL